MKFRKKPVIIDAEQFDCPIEGANEPAIQTRYMFMDFPVWCDGQGPHLKIPTLEGEMRANPGDWIIIGVQGEHYPCKPDIFEATYEAVP